MDYFNAKRFNLVQMSISILIGFTLVTLTYSKHTTSDRRHDDQVNSHQTATSVSHIIPSTTKNRDVNQVVESVAGSTVPVQTHTLHKHSHHKQRSRRHHGRHGENTKYGGAHTWKSCKTKSAFTHLTEAVDMFGKTVTIHPSVHIGKIAVDQYFYETFCDKEACECSGIDETRYRSSCETNYSFTYARVIQQGEIGWTKVMVRSGCSCVVRKRESPKWMVNIIDAI